jgi:hypothetical protein
VWHLQQFTLKEPERNDENLTINKSNNNCVFDNCRLAELADNHSFASSYPIRCAGISYKPVLKKAFSKQIKM